MRITASISAILLLCVSGPGAGGDKPNRDRDPWNGFGVGSWAVQMESFKRGNETEAHREKRSRVATKDPGVIELRGRKEGETAGTFDGAESTSWHVPGYDPRSIRNASCWTRVNRNW